MRNAEIRDGYFAEWWCAASPKTNPHPDTNPIPHHHSAKYPSQIFRIPHFTIALLGLVLGLVLG